MVLHGLKITKLNSLDKLIKFCKWLEVTKDMYKKQHKTTDQEHAIKPSHNGGKKRTLRSTKGADSNITRQRSLLLPKERSSLSCTRPICTTPASARCYLNNPKRCDSSRRLFALLPSIAMMMMTSLRSIKTSIY